MTIDEVGVGQVSLDEYGGAAHRQRVTATYDLHQVKKHDYNRQAIMSFVKLYFFITFI